MKIFFEKWNLFETLFDKGIKPNHDSFESSVVELLKEGIEEEIRFEIKDVSPETFGIVAQKAHDFKNQMKGLYTSKKV